MAAYESIPFELPPIPWIIKINCLQNPVSSKWVENRLTLTLLASSAVMAEGHTSLQARLVIHLSFCFQGGKLVPFYKCENWPRVSGSVMGHGCVSVSYGRPWNPGLPSQCSHAPLSTLPPCWRLQVFIPVPLRIPTDALDDLTHTIHTLATSKWSSPARPLPWTPDVHI